ncbi:MAG: glycoside hydrolase family 97 catalytic domain-containing protein [Bacteroidota bacterium]
MKRMLKSIMPGIALAFLLTSCQQNSNTWQLDSPSQKIRVDLSMMNSGESEQLFYTVSLDDNGTLKEVMDPSLLGIVREDGRFAENLELMSVEEENNVTEVYTLVTGKKLECLTAYNALHLTFRNKNKQKVALIFRAYDGGIAFKYHFPGSSENSVRVTEELTAFDFKEGNFWAHPYDTLTEWSPAYETYYEGPVEVGTPGPWNKNGWAFPILVESEGAWLMASEAGFDGSYGASHLQGECDGGRYRIKFAEQGEAEGYYENTSHSLLPWSTPWRFIAIGETLHAIVETTLPTDLSAPSAVEDISWIKPGRASWSWWSDSDSPQDYNRILPFIDLASEMGWEYSLVDANWNLMKNGNVERLAEYANAKNVGLLLWYNSGGKHNIVEEEPRDLMDNPKARRKEFERISKLGIKGIKVDFFQSDKQEIIGHYLGILEDAAGFGLLVNFHGCTLPKGWRRTWPNLMSMEAVRGGESYKFDPAYPELAPSHLAILPFTRNAVGPVDYTPCGFSDHTYPHLTTYGFELALPVLLESGIMHYMDTPERTAQLPDDVKEFLKRLPVAWDDTKYLAGYPGKEAIVARKKGDLWYVGAINGEDRTKELVVDLSPLGALPDSALIFGDGPTGKDLHSFTGAIQQGKMVVKMLPYGGIAGILF